MQTYAQIHCAVQFKRVPLQFLHPSLFRVKYAFLVLWLHCILLSSPAILSAQSVVKIQGTVSDRNTRLPLENANITLVNTAWGTSSDSYGSFTFENLPQATYTLRISHIGYATLTISDIHVEHDSPRELRLELVPHDLIMQAVEVDANREWLSTFSGHTILTRGDINGSGANDVGDLLKQVPGIEIEDQGGPAGIRKISIRGSKSNQVLVLLDGVPLNSHLDGDADLSQIPLNLVETIEVVTGAEAQRYGSGALGGALLITSRQVLEHSTTLATSTGAFGQYMVNPSFSGQYQDFNILASWQYRSATGDFPYSYRNSAGETMTENRQNADLAAQNLYFRLGSTWQQHSITAFVQNLDSHRGVPGKIDGWTPWARTGYQQWQSGLDYRYQGNPIQVSIQPRYTTHHTENSNLYPNDAPLRYKRYPQYHYTDRNTRFRVNNRLDWQAFGSTRFTAGYDYQFQNFSHENLMLSLTPNDFDIDETAQGAYVDMDWRFKRYLVLLDITPVLRYDRMHSQGSGRERRDEQWSPAVSGRMSLGTQHKLNLSGGLSKSYRIPTFADLYYQDVRIDGNPDLLPESALNREMGIGYEFNSRVIMSLDFTGFHSKIRDQIVWRLGSFQVFRPYNTDAEIGGQEYRLGLSNAGQTIHLQCSYSHLTPLNKNDNQTTLNRDLPYRARSIFKSNLYLNYRYMSLHVMYRYGGKRFVNEANTQSLSPYQVWDVDLGYTCNLAAIDIKIKGSLYNLTDTRYTIIRDMPLPGREWRLGMDITF